MQMRLLLCLAVIFKAMKASSIDLQAQLKKLDALNWFPKVLPTKKIEWELMQSIMMDLQTLTLPSSYWIHGSP